MTATRPSRADTCSNGQVAGRYLLDEYAVVWAHGEIDVATAPALMHELAGAVRGQRRRDIVDLTQVTFMDASGLSALEIARRRAEAGNGEVRLVGACGIVRKVLRITGLEQIFPVHATVEESIGRRPAVHHHRTVVQLPARSASRG
jgi:anti-sigma B factor antagonist